MVRTPRLDILIYAHDGRGLGHASRSIGVGLALRRLFPELKVLLVTGCRLSQELIGAAPLDWLKLPSYETQVVQGKSQGIAGKSNYSDEELGRLRARQLVDILALYRPRLVLVDHTPQGKHKELVPALAAGGGGKTDTIWVLGVRGVVGSVAQASSELATALFAEHYRALLWYGDSTVLGPSHCRLLRQQFGFDPVECGYVLRLAEFVVWNLQQPAVSAPSAGTIAIPWLGEGSRGFLARLAEALMKIPASFGRWNIFIDTGADPGLARAVGELFQGISHCRVAPPGAGYVRALLHSKTALVYGGYNSLMDIFHTRLPALVVLREMADEEQQIHLGRLTAIDGINIAVVLESQVTADELAGLLLGNLHKEKTAAMPIRADGAATAARYLHRLLYHKGISFI
jgi:predicted glycosyltransferase